jgi:hypothetical protein
MAEHGLAGGEVFGAFGDARKQTGMSRSSHFAIYATASRWNVGWPARIRVALTSPRLPLLVAARTHPKFADAAKRHLSFGRLQRVHCEFTQMTPYVNLGISVPERTLNIHDIAMDMCCGWSGNPFVCEVST